ncbi:MAG: beta-propeller domain-containing protein [Actinobacteria bacterium]|nr:beta-propeller domain-containing protein [Actinomycetota bacterium]
MNEPVNPDPRDDDDPVLSAAGARLRARMSGIAPSTVEAAALRRRSRRMTGLAAAALVAVVALAGVVVAQRGDDGGAELAVPAGSDASPQERASAEALLSSLDAQPVDPTKVKLVSTVSTFADCDALIGDLRRVGAEHVGSRGFGGYDSVMRFEEVGYAIDGDVGVARSAADSMATSPGTTAPASGTGADETTLGTNVQVVGVDELDDVKAVGKKIYDLDGKGNLRITSSESFEVLSTLDVTPNDDLMSVSQILVDGDRVAVFGTENEISDPVEGDPSATQSSTSYLTVTFVDATDASAPTISDRVRVEGRLVSARLVDGEIRLVTTSDMADLGFVMPTTPTSVAKALEQNRRSVALSTAADWIPDWQRGDEAAQPLVPCDRVHVPDTFAGVAMTSMVTFPIGTGTFDPTATSILAPGDTLYAGLDTVAISSGVWVDPIDRDRLTFDDWQTAIHEFSFVDGEAPAYDGTGIVDGSTVGQFAFGEVGDSLSVVTTTGTPWAQDTSNNAVDLTLLTANGDGDLTATATVEDLAGGKGEVAAVRYVEGRVLVSTGLFGRVVQVVDVSDPTAPRKAGNVTLPGDVTYFHPLPDDRALLVGRRSDTVGSGDEKRSRSWVQAHLLDVSDPDAPQVVSTWERPWSADQVGSDHHAFTYWPDRNLAMWGIQDTQWEGSGEAPANHAVVVGTEGSVSEVAVPVANKPNEVPAPCPEVPITDPELQDMVGRNGKVLHCGDAGTKTVEWPRWQCYKVDEGTVARYAPDDTGGTYFMCNPAGQPVVSRVLVVGGTPILYTDQTLEALDPQSFASTRIAYHPSAYAGTYMY